MKEKNVKRLTPQKALVFSLLLTLFFTALSGALLRDFGKISISTVNLSTLNGNQVSARIFKPHSATAENPAPAVILTHGLTVNKESYSQYGLELARRGFVVIGCGLPLLPVGVKKHSFGKSWRVLFLSSHVPALRNRCIHRTQQRISLQDRQGTGMGK